MNRILSKTMVYYDYFCRILLLLMSLLVVTFVFMRYLFGITFIWAEEAITMLFISTTFFGAVLGVKDNEHININFFVELIPKSIRRYIDIFSDFIILGVQIFMIYLSLEWIGKVGNVLTKGLRLPIRYFYYMMPISSILIGIFCVISIVKRITALTMVVSPKAE
jgi:TRAP-type transport system small permease protein